MPRRLVYALLWLAAAALVVERLRTWLAAPPSDFDDAYMFVRYADNLRSGLGMVWNRGGGRVYGATGLVHLAVVTMLRALQWPDWRVLRAASTGAAVAALAIMAATVARFATHPWLRVAPVAVIAVVAGVGWSEAFTFQAATGMDTMSSLAANALVVAATLALVAAPSRRRALWCAAAAWLAIEARPDAAPIAVGTPLVALVLVVRDRRLVATFALPLAAVVAASLAAKRALLGTALPLAFWAKRPHAYGGFAGEWTWNPFWFLGVFLRAAAAPIVVVALAARRRHARILIALVAPATVGIAALFGVNQIMGHLGRFDFPALASLVAAAAVASDGLPMLTVSTFAVRLAVAVAIVVGGGVLTDAAGARWQAHAETQRLADLGGYTIAAPTPLPDVDSWEASQEMAALAAAAPPGARLAMSEHGLVAARAPEAVIIDVLGLHDRWFALHGFSAAELFRRRPDLIWMPHPDHTQIIRDILDDDSFWRDYDFWPDALTFGVALRRGDDATATALRQLFVARFEIDYPGLALDDYRARRKMPP